jgi:hypothetical protein
LSRRSTRCGSPIRSSTGARSRARSTSRRCRYQSGPTTNSSAPPDHVDFLRNRLGRQYHGIDLLVIGYSGNDQEAVGLIKGTGRNIRTLAVVNENRSAADDVESKLREQGLIAPADGLYFSAGDFAAFARREVLEEYLGWLKSRSDT